MTLKVLGSSSVITPNSLLRVKEANPARTVGTYISASPFSLKAARHKEQSAPQHRHRRGLRDRRNFYVNDPLPPV